MKNPHIERFIVGQLVKAIDLAFLELGENLVGIDYDPEFWDDSFNLLAWRIRYAARIYSGYYV